MACGKRRGFQAASVQAESGVIEKAGGAVNAVGLPGGTGIGEGEVFVVEEICVVHAGVRGIDVGFPPATIEIVEREILSGDLHADLACVRRPEAKAMHSDQVSSK